MGDVLPVVGLHLIMGGTEPRFAPRQGQDLQGTVVRAVAGQRSEGGHFLATLGGAGADDEAARRISQCQGVEVQHPAGRFEPAGESCQAVPSFVQASIDSRRGWAGYGHARDLTGATDALAKLPEQPGAKE